MPLAHAKFFGEPREFTEAQIEELRESGLLHDDPVPAPEPVKPPAAATAPAVPKENRK